MKHAGGRPSKYDPSFCQKIVDYFSVEPYRVIPKTKREIPNDLPFLSNFADSIGVNQDTLHEWCKVHPEFSEAFKKAKELQEQFLVINGLRNNFAQPFTIFAMKNMFRWTDRHEVTGKDGQPLMPYSLFVGLDPKLVSNGNGNGNHTNGNGKTAEHLPIP